MIERNFFGHVNPDGDNIAGRAEKAGIISPIGENLAMGTNLTTAYLSLEESPSHFKNPDWARVGYGIGINQDGMVVVTVLFSTRNI